MATIGLKLAVSAVFLGMAFLARNSAIGRALFAYPAAMGLSIYFLALGGLLLFAQLPAKAYEMAMLGFGLGVIAGIILGFFIGRAAAGSPAGYWVLLGVAALGFALLPKM